MRIKNSRIVRVFLLIALAIVIICTGTYVANKIDDSKVEPTTKTVNQTEPTSKVKTSTTIKVSESTTDEADGAKTTEVSKTTSETIKVDTSSTTKTKITTTRKNVVQTTRPVQNTTNKQNEVNQSAFYLSDYERHIVECIVMGESGDEPYEGQVLVAQCIFNACVKDGLQPSAVQKRYQYAGYKNNPSTSVKKAVSAVFDDGYKITNEPILYFYAPRYVHSSWHESQRFVCEVGHHRFFAQW